MLIFSYLLSYVSIMPNTTVLVSHCVSKHSLCLSFLRCVYGNAGVCVFQSVQSSPVCTRCLQQAGWSGSFLWWWCLRSPSSASSFCWPSSSTGGETPSLTHTDSWLSDSMNRWHADRTTPAESLISWMTLMDTRVIVWLNQWKSFRWTSLPWCDLFYCFRVWQMYACVFVSVWIL